MFAYVSAQPSQTTEDLMWLYLELSLIFMLKYTDFLHSRFYLIKLAWNKIVEVEDQWLMQNYFLFSVGNFGIVEPFPKNIYPIEFTPAKVTCVAYDTAGIEIPEKILFVRRNDFGEYRVLTANDNLYFTKRTEGRHMN